jgi:hypothetical protein
VGANGCSPLRVEDDVHPLIHSLENGASECKVFLQETEKLEKLIALLNTPGVSELLERKY